MRVVLFIIIVFLESFCFAARIKDIANVRGVRNNQLVGYGIVVGLNGTGDSKTEYTNKSVVRMLDKLGMKISAKGASSKNVAAVIVTAELPAFSRAGNRMDITVNSLGDASSLKGGTLIQTPLRAANQQTYAVAQGPVLVGFSATGVHETVASIPNGAIIERDMSEEFASRKMFRIMIFNPDFTTAARVAKRINMNLGGKYATALDGATIDLVSPSTYEGKGVELLSMIERLEVNPDVKARVVVSEKTGTVIIGDNVKVLRVAISHGDLSIKIGTGPASSKKNEDRVLDLKKSANVGELVQTMNKLGVSPKDLITILKSINSAGALQGDLEIL